MEWICIFCFVVGSLCDDKIWACNKVIKKDVVEEDINMNETWKRRGRKVKDEIKEEKKKTEDEQWNGWQ